MIFMDVIEKPLDRIKSAPMLKKLTGANAMLSELALPPVNEKFVQKHIASGAILYRIVTTQELMDVSEEELLLNLSKMLSLGCKTYQCVILMDSSHTLFDYEANISKIDAWVEHGGTSMFTYGYTAVYVMAKREEKFLATADSRKTILLPKFGPRKMLEVNKDWTVTLATFPYIGYQGAQTIRKLINQKDLGDDLLTAILFLTSREAYEKSDGQWLVIRKAAREWMGLPDNFDLDITFTGKEIKE